MAFTAKQARNQAIAISEAYTKESMAGGGAVKGKNCTIQSIAPILDTDDNTKVIGKLVTFAWYLDNATTPSTSIMEIMYGNDGVGIDTIAVDNRNHIIVTYTDGTTEDIGEVEVSFVSMTEVETLPSTGQSNIIYLVPTESENVYAMYIWDISNNVWKRVGSTQIDLSQYYTKTQTDNLLNLKLDASEKGSAGGVAELDSNGLVPATQLPSYVDDVLEGTAQGVTETAAGTYSATGFILRGGSDPAILEEGKTYVDITSNIQYRWTGTGTNLVSMGSNLSLGETLSTAYRGDRGKAGYDHSQITDGSNPHNTTANNIDLATPIVIDDQQKTTVEAVLRALADGTGGDYLSSDITAARIEEIADGVFSNALQLTVGQYYKMGTAPNYQDNTELVPIYWMCAEKLADGIYAMQCSCMDNGFFGPNYMEPHDYSYTDIRSLADFDNDPSNTSAFYAAFSSIEANGGRNSSGVYVAGAAKNGLYLPSLRELGVTAEQVDAAEEGTVVGTGYYWQSLVDSMNADPMDGTEGSWIAYVGENKNLANVPYNVFNDFIFGYSWDSSGGLYPVFNIDTSKIEVSQDNTITVKGD